MSYSATTSKSNYLLLASGITISSGLLALCVYGYMLQQTAIPVLFFWLFGVVLLCLIVLAWFPATKGLNYKIHFWSVWIKTYLMFSVVALMYVDAYDSWSKGDSMVNGWMHAVGAAFILALAVTTTFTNQKDLSPKKLFTPSSSSILFSYFQYLRGFILPKFYFVRHGQSVGNATVSLLVQQTLT